MLKPIITIVASTAVIASFITITNAGRDGERRGEQPPRGPDVVAWYLGGSNGNDIETYDEVDGVRSYAFGTTSCNFGDMEANWGIDGDTSYPVIAQNCYRIKDGRFEQIGTAWLKHSFCAVSEPGCGECVSTPCSTLGIGCADTYWAGLNADATAPRSAINAFTGEYSFPFEISPTGPSSMRGRLHMKTEDVSPELNEESIYLIEGQYVSDDDAEWLNQDNNASYRWIKFLNPTLAIGLSSTQVGRAAIYGWAFFDEAVDVRKARVPEEGLLNIGARVHDNGDGTWDYVYAVHNLNSDRSVGSISIPISECMEISDVGFNDVDYHSGEIIDSTDWESEIYEDRVEWTTDSYDSNEWANAIRWGSTYTFWFTSTQGPSEGAMDIGIFKPGGEPSMQHALLTPSCPADCLGDINNSGLVDVLDLLVIVGEWGTSNEDADVTNDGIVNINDLLAVMADWGCA